MFNIYNSVVSYFDKFLSRGNEETPISVLRGFNGIVELYDNRVDIRKDKNKAHISLNLDNILEIHIKEMEKISHRYLSFVPKENIDDKEYYQQKNNDICTVVTNYKPEIIYKFASEVQNACPEIEIINDC